MVLERRADHILRTCRARTGNSDYSATSGIPQRELVQFLNEAQERIYNKMLQCRSSLFQKQAYLNTVSGTAAIDLPVSDIYLDHNIVTVMFAYNGNPINYAPMELRTVRQEVSVQGYPSSYFLMGDQIILSPIPSNTIANALKITYQKVAPALDIRRALVASCTTTTITLTDNTTLLTETEEDMSEGWVDYVSMVNKDGTAVASSIPITGYSDTTKIATGTLTGAQVTAITAAVAAGCYLVFGKNATTNAWLPQVAERFLTEYVTFRIQMRDSNKESADTSPLLLAIEKEILDAIEELEEDISAIPILDHSMINYADEL